MSSTNHHHQDGQLSEHDRTRNLITAACAALIGGLGYAIALGLARATEHAEELEEDAYCHPTAPSPAR